MKYALLIGLLLLGACAVETLPEMPDTGDETGDTALTGSYDDVDFDPSEGIEVKSFGSEDELSAFIKQHESSGFYGMARSVPMMDAAVGAVAMEEAALQKVAGEDYSTTNNQVAAVDEADLIKTDGEYIYTISGKTVFIIEAGEDASVLSTIKLENTPQDLFIKDDKLAVFGTVSSYDFEGFVPRQGMSFFYIYDVSDRSDPDLEKEFMFEGRYFRARMTDHVYLVTMTGMQHRPVPMPIIMEDGVKRTMPVSDVHYFNIPYDNPQFANIHSIGLGGELLDSKSIAVEYDQNMYMSEDNIFITYTKRVDEWELQREIVMDLLDDELTSSDRDLIQKIKRIDDDILSKSEKDAKIYEVYESYMAYMDQEERDSLMDEAEEQLKETLEEMDSFEWTVVNKVAVSGGNIDVVANGKVPGRIINQFSMDEDDGVFRIATTKSQRWSRFGRTESSNNVYALDEGLEVVGSLEGLAEGESIYSTRFMDDRLYMVTFEQIDPFFVIDLSDPADIEELGELKIPGFSRYLHPYSDNVIIGIGQDASATGRARGLKISLFDVSDVSDPEEIAKWESEQRYSRSNALYEHRAFLFDREKELLVIPAYSYDEDDSYNGALVFRIEEDEIELRGLVDHSQGAERWSPQVERSLWIEDLLYTKSPSLLRVNEIDSLESVKNITLVTEPDGVKVY